MKLNGFKSMYDMMHASIENLKNSFVKEYSNECEGTKPMKPKKKRLSDSALILKKLDQLESKVDKLEIKVDKGFKNVNKRIDNLENRLNYIVKANKLKDIKK